jgi:hypothetical protein
MLRAMDRLSAQIDLARGLVKEMVELARELLRSDADADRIHRQYIVQALEILAEIEAQGVLAASGVRSSTVAIEDQIRRLSLLKREAAQELDLYSDRD